MKSKKLIKPYSGPHIVLAVVNAVTYKIKLSRSADRVVHGDRLKPYYGNVTVPCMKKMWVPVAKGSTLADRSDAYVGVAALFDIWACLGASVSNGASICNVQTRLSKQC